MEIQIMVRSLQSKLNPLMLQFLLLSLIILQVLAQTVPQSFAFITVTHTRGKDFTIIQNHIQRYAAMQCPIAAELNIVWNNEIQPDKAPIILDKNLWKRPVNFYKTPSNSMDWRYTIPSQSKAEVFFIVDDDVVVDCQELQRGFKVWQQNAIGNVGPIVTYAVRYFEYTQDHSFAYGRAKEREMFAIGLVGVSFMSRHFMDLYYAKIQLLEEMRKIVREKNNCDDIGINWLIQYFYPELETIYVQAVNKNLLANSPAIAQSTSPKHYPYRSQCILQFTKLFGINALRYKPIHDEGRKDIRIQPLRNATVKAKHEYLQAIIRGQSPPNKEIHDGQAVGRKNDQDSKAIKELQSNLTQMMQLKSMLEAEVKRMQQNLKDCKGILENSQSITVEKQLELSSKQKDSHNANIPLAEILAVSIVLLVLIISGLIYKIITLTHSNRVLQLQSNQVDAIEMNSSDEAE